MTDSITDHLLRATSSKIWAASVTPTPGINNHDNQKRAAAMISSSPAFRDNISNLLPISVSEPLVRPITCGVIPDIMHLSCQITTQPEVAKATVFPVDFGTPY